MNLLFCECDVGWFSRELLANVHKLVIFVVYRAYHSRSQSFFFLRTTLWTSEKWGKKSFHTRTFKLDPKWCMFGRLFLRSLNRHRLILNSFLHRMCKPDMRIVLRWEKTCALISLLTSCSFLYFPPFSQLHWQRQQHFVFTIMRITLIITLKM